MSTLQITIPSNLSHNYEYSSGYQYSPKCVDCGQCDCFGDGFVTQLYACQFKNDNGICKLCEKCWTNKDSYLSANLSKEDKENVIYCFFYKNICNNIIS